MSGGTGKVTTIFVGIGVLCVIGLGFTFWKDLVVHYHFSRLVSDEFYLREISPAAANSAEQMAIAKYMHGKLAPLARTFEARRYPQRLAPRDERLLREQYSLLSSFMYYDPNTGVAVLDYTSGAHLRIDLGPVVSRLQARGHISFVNPVTEDDAPGLSFAGNTRGTILIPIPFKYRVRVEWDMSIQTMDSNGTFNAITMYNRKRSHYMTNWVHWQSSKRGAAPKTVKAVPGKYSGSADFWFDKTRDIGMVVEFNAPGVDLDSDQSAEEQLTDTATMSVVYDTKVSPIENTFKSSSPITNSGYLGFKWNRVKFAVKRLRISGILDKKEAVAQIKKMMKI